MPKRKAAATAPRMPTVPRRTNRFRERELARAVRAAKSAGGERVEIDPATGKISVILTKPAGKSAADNEVEGWLSKQGRHADQC
jgi:hypothetical protein